jgi:L-histidine N-alpha-methyltransferase
VAAIKLENRLPDDFFLAGLRRDVLEGLSSDPKWLSPKWFYDQRGSALFEEITRLPEYYPTRAEREILAERAGEIAEASGAVSLVELGAGSATKTRLLLDAFRDVGALAEYVPVDVSPVALGETVAALRREYPGLRVRGVLADFERSIPTCTEAPTMVAFLGGTIGNFLPGERRLFLQRIRDGLRPGDSLLLGTDLVKDPSLLVRAYDDRAGVTAEFNKNVLSVLNAALTADFDPSAFDHVAHWDPDREWIEMRLQARRAQTIQISALGLTVTFDEGEEVRTEISAKFRRETITAELLSCGFDLSWWWRDSQERFGLSLSTVVSSAPETLGEADGPGL